MPKVKYRFESFQAIKIVPKNGGGSFTYGILVVSMSMIGIAIKHFFELNSYSIFNYNLRSKIYRYIQYILILLGTEEIHNLL